MSMDIDSNLLNFLKQVGFQGKQQQIIAYLLKTDSSTAGIIAKKTGLKRPAIYAILDDLINQGLVSKTVLNKVNHYSISSRESFCESLKYRLENNFTNSSNAISDLSKYLKNLPSSYNINQFSVSALNSKEDVLKLMLETLTQAQGFVAVFNPQVTITDDTYQNVKTFLSTTAAKNIPIKEIVVKGVRAEWYRKQIKNSKHLIKLIPANKKLVTDFIAFGDNLIIFNHIPGNEYAILIKDKYLSQSFKAIFELLWL